MRRYGTVMLRVAFRPLLVPALAFLSVATVPQRAAAQVGGDAPPELPQPVDQPLLDAEAPLAPMEDIGVAWPDMQADQGIADGAADGATSSTDLAAEARRYTVQLEGLEGLGATPVKDRFSALSVLKTGEKDDANSAQIDRRIRQDSELLGTILRASGYYDARVDSEVESTGTGPIRIKLIVTAGPLYRFADVDVTGIERTGDRQGEFSAILGVGEDDVVDADDVTGGQAALADALRRQGYPFAKVADPDVVVDHETRSATLAMAVDPGGLRKFGAIKVVGDKPPFGAKHVGVIARFKAGEPYDQAWIDDLKRALIATGVVGGVNVSPVPSSDPELADISVSMERAPLRTISAEIGYGTGEGLSGEASWTHRNLIGPEGAVTLRTILGTREQMGGVVFRKSNFRARDVALNGRLTASNINRSAYDARSIDLGVGIERQSNIIWQKKWTWSAGAELIATDERDMTAGLLKASRSTYFIGALPLSLGYDKSNDLLDPVRGFRLGLRLSPEASLRSGVSAYVRAQVDASGYVPVRDNVVMAGRVRFGTIGGAGTLDLAPSRRFYAGGGSSVRGYGYQQIGPRDAANDPVGGRSLAEFSLEARVRWRDFGFVPFVDGGNIYSRAYPTFSGFRYGAGMGFRYHSTFGPIRVDVGTPINPRQGDSRVTVFVSLGQAF